MTNKLKKEIEKTRIKLVNMMNNKGLGHFTDGTLNIIYADAINYICQYCIDGGRQGKAFGLCLKLQELQAKLSQKQEDDERFEEFIEGLKNAFDIDYKNVWGINQIKEKIDELAEEFKGEQKQ